MRHAAPSLRSETLTALMTGNLNVNVNEPKAKPVKVHVTVKLLLSSLWYSLQSRVRKQSLNQTFSFFVFCLGGGYMAVRCFN